MNYDLAAFVTQARSQVSAAFEPPQVRHDDMVLTWHPMVLADAAARALGERLLDAVYAAHVPALRQARITVACPALSDGLGDLALAWRVCAALRSQASEGRISLVVPDSARAEPLREGAAWVQVVPAAAAFAAIPVCDLLVVAPDPSAARYSSPAMQSWLAEAARRYPTLAVSEYGSGVPQDPRWRTLATGLGPLVDGLFIDASVAQAAPGLRSADAPSRQAAMRAWANTALHCAPDAAWRALHIIYVREPQALQQAVTRAMFTHTGNAADLLLLVLRHAVSGAQVTTWQGAGLQVALAQPSALARPEGVMPATGFAQLLPVGTLPPEQFRAGLLHAEFAAITGDQSLSEAIAAQVPFAYEARPHKQTLAHRLQEVASRFGPETHRAMAPLGPQPPPPAAPTAAWQAMCTHVCATSDATPRLVGRAARTLHATDDRRALEAAVIDACRVPSTAAAGAALLTLLGHLRASLANA